MSLIQDVTSNTNAAAERVSEALTAMVEAGQAIDQITEMMVASGNEALIEHAQQMSQACTEVREQLAAAGHDISELTSLARQFASR